MRTRILVIALLLAAAAFAQAPQHYVKLAWVDTVNPTGTVYNVYRLAGACPATAPNVEPDGFTRIATALTVMTYTDTAVTTNTTYCYFLTAGVVGEQGPPAKVQQAGMSQGPSPVRFPLKCSKLPPISKLLCWLFSWL